MNITDEYFWPSYKSYCLGGCLEFIYNYGLSVIQTVSIHKLYTDREINAKQIYKLSYQHNSGNRSHRQFFTFLDWAKHRLSKINNGYVLTFISIEVSVEKVLGKIGNTSQWLWKFSLHFNIICSLIESEISVSSIQ